MNCPKCGYTNSDSDLYCGMCYHVLKKENGAASVSLGNNSAPTSAPQMYTPRNVSTGPDSATPILDTSPSSPVLKDIKNAWIAAVISATITLIFSLISLGTTVMGGIINAWSLVDVVLIYALAYGIAQKNRLAAVVMLVYFVASKIYMWTQTGKLNGIFIAALFIYYFYKGMVATFQYHASRRP